ncbi:acetyl-CoA carboxylase biotin carboxylase subunit [Legionella sp. W05-934-2]|uniref:acetyl/propionyl/methylcrotonyl-CoA carboxylase subunit alpha n=1 Tax=Legionella sp. W05-934-2 TaxID=1198649 RepID=UPI003462ACE3
MRPIKTLLIANRGEIACRIMRSAQQQGIHCVAVYSDADKHSLHVEMANSAYCIGNSPASESYLNIDKIIAVAKHANADAIHPGYGFLSENPDLAKACEKADIIWVGPGIKALNAMASKQLAKQLLEKTRVPLTPGYHGDLQGEDHLQQEAKKIGYPVLIKAAAGGGGKGMRAVSHPNEFIKALQGAKREAKASFGDDKMIIEKLIEKPRHVEIQILADQHGNRLHLYERDCSIQRRHQKIIEEAPAPNLSEKTRQGLYQAALTVAETIGYVNAGTVEFLVDSKGDFYFMEMNTRLQVEHPVTEMITGLDLVSLQLLIASGQPLPIKQSDIPCLGHAIECRIYAEDADNQFLPSIGTLTHHRPPQGEHIRVDAGVCQGKSISQYYDPMIAKLIVWGESRDVAIARMNRSLAQYAISGVKTNIAFCRAICQQQPFIDAELSTNYLANYPPKPRFIPEEKAFVLSACLAHHHALTRQANPVWHNAFAFRLYGQAHWTIHRLANTAVTALTIFPLQGQQLRVSWQNQQQTATWLIEKNTITIELNDRQETFHFFECERHQYFWSDEGMAKIERIDPQYKRTQQGTDKQLTAPMPATVVAIHKKPGEQVKQGEAIIVLEAMKMEHSIEAPYDGTLESLCFQIGEQVNEGAELVIISKLQEAHVDG